MESSSPAATEARGFSMEPSSPAARWSRTLRKGNLVRDSKIHQCLFHSWRVCVNIELPSSSNTAQGVFEVSSIV
ncbi:hypothetical protein EK904_012787 [Melospiza melodia maxima]|nr:hypothetical protein EK904_012787 [Melospiza melodia maxima]